MPRLVIKQGPGVGRDHALGGGECVVGRDASVTFVLDDHLASRRHFKIVAESGATPEPGFNTTKPPKRPERRTVQTS